MNILKKTLLTSALLTCAAAAFAAPQPHEGPMPHPGEKECHAMMGPPPAPVYSVTEQTANPAEALNSVVKNVPALEQGKKYEIRVEVKELPPAPPASQAQDAPAPAPQK